MFAEHRDQHVVLVGVECGDEHVRLVDLLAPEKPCVRRVVVHDECLRELLGEFARPVLVALDELRREVACLEQACGVVADLAATDDDNLVCLTGCRRRGEKLCELLDAPGASDDNRTVAGTDTRTSLWQHEVPVPEQCCERHRVEPVGRRDCLAGDLTLRRDVELGHLDETAGKAPDVDRRRQSDDVDDRLGSFQIGADHEVDIERRSVALPGLLVLVALYSGDSEAVTDCPGRSAGHEIRLVVVGTRDDDIRLDCPHLRQHRRIRAVTDGSQHVDVVSYLLDAGFVDIDNRDIVIGREVCGYRGADLAGADDHDLHEDHRCITGPTGAVDKSESNRVLSTRAGRTQ